MGLKKKGLLLDRREKMTFAVKTTGVKKRMDRLHLFVIFPLKERQSVIKLKKNFACRWKGWPATGLTVWQPFYKK